MNLLEGAEVRRTELIQCNSSEGLCPDNVCLPTAALPYLTPSFTASHTKIAGNCKITLLCHRPGVWDLPISTSLPQHTLKKLDGPWFLLFMSGPIIREGTLVEGLSII